MKKAASEVSLLSFFSPPFLSWIRAHISSVAEQGKSMVLSVQSKRVRDETAI